jgi:predicted O-methyltransferase YrrM
MIDLMRDEYRLGPGILSGLVAMCDSLCVEESGRLMYEIGSYVGESAVVFARFFREVHCVDPWKDMDYYGSTDAEVEAAFDERVRRFPNIIKHKMTSVEASATVPDLTLDFVYIDGRHELPFVMEDLEAWWPKVRVGGAIGGHDYLPYDFAWTEVSKAVDSYFNRLIQVFPDSSWLVRK